MKKYELLTFDKIVIGGATLHRIRALIDIRIDGMTVVDKHSLGGYVQSETNLSHEGLCWIGGQAKAYGKSRVYENAVLTGEAEICQRAQAFGDCLIEGTSKVRANAKVSGCALLKDVVIEGITHLKE